MREFRMRPLCGCGCGNRLQINKWAGKYATYIRGHFKRVVTEEQKQRMSEARKGAGNPNYGNRGIKNPLYGKKVPLERRRKLSATITGAGNPMFGRKHSPEAILKMSLIKMRENNPYWNGRMCRSGYSDEWYDKEYREDIKSRDNYTCQANFNNKHSKQLVLHHLDFDRGNGHPDNLIVLCHACHMRIHLSTAEEKVNEIRQQYIKWGKECVWERLSIQKNPVYVPAEGTRHRKIQ